MRRGLFVIVFLLVVFGLAALLSPPVYWLVQSVARSSPAWHEIAENPFGRYLTRLLMVCAVIGVWPLIKVTRLRWTEIGLTAPDWKRFARGIALALISLGIVIAVAMVLDARQWRRDPNASRIIRSIIMATLGAALTAPIEEILFRGVLFGLLRNPKRWIGALVVSSAIFAVVHLLQTPREIGNVEWDSGFTAVGRMLSVSEGEPQVLVMLLNLFLCGVALAWSFQRTGTLWFSIGLHAGWIFWLKFANTLTTVTSNAVFWGSRKLVDGWAATAALLITISLIPLLTRNPKSNHAPTNREFAARME